MFIVEIQRIKKDIQFYNNQFRKFFLLDNNKKIYINCYGEICIRNTSFLHNMVYELIGGQNDEYIFNYIQDFVDNYTFILDRSLKFKYDEFNSNAIFNPIININKNIIKSLNHLSKGDILNEDNKCNDDNNSFLKVRSDYIRNLTIIFNIYYHRIVNKRNVEYIILKKGEINSIY
tara:strand:- start:3900 stop:4424 length:525 start_codon:yes stop_codon:yes gene_type:complete